MELVDGEFWLDKIKSQCFVTYNTLEEAQNAREALDGCRWPSTNPKTLSIRFARKEEFEFSKTHDLPPNHVSSDSTDRVVEEESTSPVDGKVPKNHSDEPKHSGFLITEDEINEESIKTNEQPGKGLDDYFRKTKAKPSIYWLPLTDEEILERVQRQEQRKVERDEEQRKRDNDENIRKSEKRKHSASPLLRQDSKRH
jgi:apoptotic chromatin condensation inducer in the nucleus